eukprot:7582609-Lingulodinium_polyedra.AAC.1
MSTPAAFHQHSTCTGRKHQTSTKPSSAQDPTSSSQHPNSSQPVANSSQSGLDHRTTNTRFAQPSQTPVR